MSFRSKAFNILGSVAYYGARNIADWLERYGPSDQPDQEPVGHLTPHGSWTTKIRQDIDE